MAEYQNLFTRVQVSAPVYPGVPLTGGIYKRQGKPFLSYLLGIVGDTQIGPFYLGLTGLASLLCGFIEDVQPDTVLTFGPDGGTFHEDHIAVSRWTTLACRAAARHGGAGADQRPQQYPGRPGTNPYPRQGRRDLPFRLVGARPAVGGSAWLAATL